MGRAVLLCQSSRTNSTSLTKEIATSCILGDGLRYKSNFLNLPTYKRRSTVQTARLIGKFIFNPRSIKAICTLQNYFRPSTNSSHMAEKSICRGELQVWTMIIQMVKQRPDTLICWSVQTCIWHLNKEKMGNISINQNMKKFIQHHYNRDLTTDIFFILTYENTIWWVKKLILDSILQVLYFLICNTISHFYMTSTETF